MRGGRSTARASSMAGPEHADPVMVRGRPRSDQTKGGSAGGRACSCPPKDRASALRALGADRRRRSLVPCHRATDRRRPATRLGEPPAALDEPWVRTNGVATGARLRGRSGPERAHGWKNRLSSPGEGTIARVERALRRYRRFVRPEPCLARARERPAGSLRPHTTCVPTRRSKRWFDLVLCAQKLSSSTNYGSRSGRAL
jgi:hypothetical protein